MAQARQSHASAAHHDAMARIREMQDRARQGGAANPFRNWSTDPNIRRSRPHTPTRQEEPPPAPPHEPTPQQEQPQPAPNSNRQAGQNHQRHRRQAPSDQPQPLHASVPRQDQEQAAPEAPKDTTLLQDILGGVGLDDDRILILGLILILINSKADATLILALLYLMF